jgi:hypothetical protein
MLRGNRLLEFEYLGRLCAPYMTDASMMCSERHFMSTSSILERNYEIRAAQIC